MNTFLIFKLHNCIELSLTKTRSTRGQECCACLGMTAAMTQVPRNLVPKKTASRLTFAGY